MSNPITIFAYSRDFTRIRNDRTRLVITRTMRVPMVDDSSCDSCEKIRFWGAGESSRITLGIFLSANGSSWL